MLCGSLNYTIPRQCYYTLSILQLFLLWAQYHTSPGILCWHLLHAFQISLCNSICFSNPISKTCFFFKNRFLFLTGYNNQPFPIHLLRNNLNTPNRTLRCNLSKWTNPSHFKFWFYVSLEFEALYFIYPHINLFFV